jgi:hypothetical protein
MSKIARQLFQLQEIDLELESDRHTLKLIIGQLGDSNSVIRAQEQMDSEKQALEEVTRQQQSLDREIEDVAAKLKKVEEDLYGGKIRNPKELTDLQHESESLKANLSRLEEQALEIMEKVESASKRVTAADSELNRLKSEWQRQQQKLTADMEKLKNSVAGLEEKRERLVKDIEPQTVEIYQEIRKQRGTAVAKVQQGTCLGCRITLPVSDLQRVRGGGMIRCSSCGRILFLA